MMRHQARPTRLNSAAIKAVHTEFAARIVINCPVYSIILLSTYRKKCL
ncbi:hypothetical protein [Legionella pneumophila]|nr:hypothetical protein [Legionella pneumophila]HAT6915689.1 hypothetical protein [Legionella pneumophila]HAT6918402.1 hypothetical protein [Legionella pneumophila]HAT6919419.1 hypothetical protein [Legionella pneumophila]HAT6921469.1 hypothetical protein [Legionella pneumophila]HAT6970905.1 hypothetical protein [Legionella pneumophila]